MELYQLQTFIIVAEEKNITRAARRLYTTPSTVSMHIKALEDELGVQLFTRTNQGVTITPKGQLLHDKAVETLRAAQDLVNHATDIQQTLMGSISLGLCTDPAVLKIPELIRQIHTDYPGIDLSLEKISSLQIIENVASGQLDLGFIFGTFSHPLVTTQYLASTELVVVLPASWAMPDFDPSDWYHLGNQPWVSAGKSCYFQMMLDQHLQGLGLSYRRLVQIDDDRSRYDLVRAGMGLSLLERYAAEQGVAAGDLKIAPVAPLECNISLAYRTHERNHPLVSCLVSLIEALHRPRS